MFLPFFFLVLHQYCQRTFFNLSPLAPKLRAADLFRKAGAKISDLFAKLQIFSLKILKVFFRGPNCFVTYRFPLSHLQFLKTLLTLPKFFGLCFSILSLLLLPAAFGLHTFCLKADAK